MAKAAVERKKGAPPNLDRILSAASRLFTTKGFNGTSTRDIAAGAGVSLGNIYNYFSTKEEIFVSLLARREKEYFDPGQPLIKALTSTAFPDNIENLGFASRETVEKFSDYILLIYVDVVEFEARHVNKMFARMRQGYAAALKASPAGKGRIAPDIDPAGALMMVTWNYFNYFIMEKLFKVKGHYGLADAEAVKLFARVFKRGILA
ncbi:MAG: TetR/AcrR family transcriptional regulator [Elusimicrobiales bacterium]|jgi:AcrR family transcriptional regulator|nr:TetR/AcrR family transcriptional regulator [Elusimicrobiales bacterium]